MTDPVFALHYGRSRKPLATVVPDDRWPGMWRIRWPDGANPTRPTCPVPKMQPECLRRGTYQIGAFSTGRDRTGPQRQATCVY